jgi:glycosyltransferase involved in cell wall biosynthesis
MAALVSILINNYNYERFIGEAIESSLSQTYGNIEILVIDDGSTDGSPAIIKSYGSRVKAIFKENGGQASAFNAGIAASRGDIICFLDSDDYFYPNKVATIAEIFARLDNSKPIMTHHMLRTAKANTVPEAPELFGKVHRNPLNLAEMARKYKYTYYQAGATTGVSINRRMANLLFPLPERGVRTSADEFVVRGASLVGELHSTPEVLGVYRVHGENAWFCGNQRMSAEYIAILDNYLNRKLAENNLPGRISYFDSMFCWWDLVREQRTADLLWRMIKLNAAQHDLHTLRFTFGMCQFWVGHVKERRRSATKRLAAAR